MRESDRVTRWTSALQDDDNLAIKDRNKIHPGGEEKILRTKKVNQRLQAGPSTRHS